MERWAGSGEGWIAEGRRTAPPKAQRRDHEGHEEAQRATEPRHRALPQGIDLASF